MDLTFTGRGLGVTDAVRETAEHKLAAISRLEPRATRIDLEFIAEHHPRVDGTTPSPVQPRRHGGPPGLEDHGQERARFPTRRFSSDGLAHPAPPDPYACR